LRILDKLATAYDRLFTEHRKALFEHGIVYLSALGFILHLALIFLGRVLPNPPGWIAAAGDNYLSALYTPFTFILFYEVLLLIFAIPESTTRSIGKQYEIISLIFIRGVFKHIADLGEVGRVRQMSPELTEILADTLGGLVMFLLVTIFRYSARRKSSFDVRLETTAALHRFIAEKKVIALGLTLLLAGMSMSSLDLRTVFYTNLFTAMIFTDVLVLILSMLVSDRYELVFRNAAFVISTVLIRASLTTPSPYNVAMAMGGMAFGILTLLVYNYHAAIRAAESSQDRG
jgi:hypothetical protein